MPPRSSRVRYVHGDTSVGVVLFFPDLVGTVQGGEREEQNSKHQVNGKKSEVLVPRRDLPPPMQHRLDCPAVEDLYRALRRNQLGQNGPRLGVEGAVYADELGHGGDLLTGGRLHLLGKLGVVSRPELLDFLAVGRLLGNGIVAVRCRGVLFWKLEDVEGSPPVKNLSRYLEPAVLKAEAVGFQQPFHGAWELLQKRFEVSSDHLGRLHRRRALVQDLP